MKHQKLLVFLGLATAVIVLSSRSLGLAFILNQDRTGAPGSVAGTCAACHNSGPWTVTSDITVLDEVTGDLVTQYTPGVQYDVKFEVTSSGASSAYGFQSTAVLDSDASNAGVFSQPSANARIDDVNGRHIFEHNDQSVSNSFTVKWTAPASGAGAVSFYGVGVAANFDGNTAGDDGSPVVQFTLSEGESMEVEGCTNQEACNFDPEATLDDGSCQLPDGCTDQTACNFDPLATCDNGSCLFISGCTDQSACNFNPDAGCDDGSCILPDGCTDESACNFNPNAQCDDGSCVPGPCVGCTYASAINFDPFAQEDDGTCLFLNPADYCGDGTIYNADTGNCEGTGTNNDCPSDLDGDNNTGTGDILLLLSAFGTSCQ